MAVDIEKRNKRQYEWAKDNKERLNVMLDKGTSGRIDSVLMAGETRSSFIREAIEKELYNRGSEKKIFIEDPELHKKENL